VFEASLEPAPGRAPTNLGSSGESRETGIESHQFQIGHLQKIERAQIPRNPRQIIMKALIAPLSGARTPARNEFILPPSTEDDLDFNRKVYDLRSVLLGTPGGLELELGYALQNRTPNLKLRGTPIPLSVFTRSQTYSQRDLSAGAGSGSNLVQTFRENSIQDALRPFCACAKAGAQFITGLRDNVAIPRWESPSSPQIVTETGVATGSDTQTASLLNLVPTRISSSVHVSFQLMRQASTMGTGIENLIAQEMLMSLSASLDAYILNKLLAMGSNAPGNRNLSLLAPGVSFGGPASWPALCSFIGNVEASNVVANDSSAWVISPSTREKWLTTEKAPSFPVYLSENNSAAGFPVFATNNLSPSNKAVFGRWDSMVVGIWAVSILIDKISLATSGTTRIFTDLWCDAGAIYGPALCASLDAANQ
jgi:hypothetical protein